jgi:hypothetical protein
MQMDNPDMMHWAFCKIKFETVARNYLKETGKTTLDESPVKQGVFAENSRTAEFPSMSK